MSGRPLALKFQLGARTLFSVPRRLVRTGLSLDDVLAERLPPLPPLSRRDDGYLVLSVPATRIPALHRAAPDCALHVRQAYNRYWTALDRPFDAWLAGLSGNARAAVRKKARRFAQAGDGVLDVREYRGAAELRRFHALARQVSALTYQERLLDAGLPDDPAFLAELDARGAAGTARGWLLFLGERPAAYLYCPSEGGTLVYDRLGFDPGLGDLSPGAVLQAEVFGRLMGSGDFARFDFTEGEGQHKRQFASDAVPCADLLLLRRSPANAAVMGALAGFDSVVTLAKRLTATPALRPLTRALRRA